MKGWAEAGDGEMRGKAGYRWRVTTVNLHICPCLPNRT